MEYIIVTVVLLAMLAAGVPVYIVLGVISGGLIVFEGVPIMSVSQIYMDHLNSLTLLAIPFFIMSATFMERGGIAASLMDFAKVVVGRMTGGLAVAGVLATTVFAAICGSSVATAVAMGVILVPAMVDQKYDRSFAVGLIGASGTLGILIPPSLAFIVYAMIAEQSVPRLFLAGLIPGLIQAGLFIIYAIMTSRRKDYLKSSQIGRKEALQRSWAALPALSIPVVILGGIYSGIVTVTEAAGVAALLSIIVSVVFYDGCKLRDVIPIIGISMRRTATILAIIMTAITFGHWLTGSGGPQQLAEFIVRANLKPWQFLIVVNIFFLVLGTFLEVMAIMLITLPIILPILGALGIDPIHFGVVMVVNMELALITPPIGLNLFVLSSSTSTPLAEVTRGVLPFIIIMLLLLIFVTYVPQVSLWLPTLVYR
ncbi:TRAP transporter large permease [Pelobacter seleniigenes]|uniref:TRAP transporter large permease n=1 Tax=Pelobacter seleniigenes TaxID=407188 RepID=UPI0004A779FA|nr:TRAP transporter large permease subunit [Pelobacter seleniigenes]